jgi:hypothetical protein
MTMDGFTVPEDAAARRLGIGLDELRERRGEKGRDWAAQGRGHRVFWTEAAVQQMAQALGVTAADTDPGMPEEKPASPAAENGRGGLVPALPEVVTGVVTRKVANHAILMARVEQGDGTAQEVTVRVGHGRAQCFTPGMRIRVRQLTGAVYSFEGNPDQPTRGRVWPRWSGRW